jgi:hypothetical protein
VKQPGSITYKLAYAFVVLEVRGMQHEAAAVGGWRAVVTLTNTSSTTAATAVTSSRGVWSTATNNSGAASTDTNTNDTSVVRWWGLPSDEALAHNGSVCSINSTATATVARVCAPMHWTQRYVSTTTAACFKLCSYCNINALLSEYNVTANLLYRYNGE